MKSTEFITEGKKKFIKMAKAINRDCKPYLKQIGDPEEYQLWRGLRQSDKPFVKKTVHLKNRVPTDSPMELHNYVNKYFKSKFGEPFRDAMFCTGDADASGFYGRSYAIFPIGDFSFLWSPDNQDLFMEWEDFIGGNEYQDPKDFIKDHIKGRYTNKNLKEGINSLNEIMIRCKKYYAVDEELYYEIEELL